MRSPCGSASSAANWAASATEAPWDKAFETLVGIQLRYHAKPVVFLDVDDFWPPLVAFLDHAVAAGVLSAEVRTLFRTASSAAAALDAVVTS